MPGDLVQRQLADKRLAGLDQLDREAVELFKIIGGEVNIFTPVGYYRKYKEEDIPTDFPFSIRTSELSAFEWSEVFEIDLNTPIGSLIERIIETLKESYFPKTKTVVAETVDNVETGNAQDIDTSGSMAVYMKAIGKGVKSAK
jgi:hypothetical protein